MIFALYLVQNIKLGLILPRIFLPLDFSYIEILVFESRVVTISIEDLDVTTFALDNFEQSYIFGELSHVATIQVGHSSVLGTDHSVPVIFLFGHHGVQTALAVGVSASSQQSRKVVPSILVAADSTVPF